MFSFNQVTLIGNVAGEIKSGFSSNNSANASFLLVMNRKIKGEDRATFVPCVAFSKIAEIITKFCSKGKQVCVSGRLDSYKKDDNSPLQVKVIVEGFGLLGKKDDNVDVATTASKLKTEDEIPF